VRLADGEALRAEHLVIATGARARAFPVDEKSGPVWTIRELADALALTRALPGSRRVAVIGGGFIGAEVASSARLLGLDVVVLEAASRPFAALLGPDVADRLARLHAEAGTELRCGVAVSRVEQVGDRQRIHLADGTQTEADVVVAGLGAVPNVEWLGGSGLVVDGAVPCDHNGRTPAQGIYAAGDVASWYDPRVGARHRHEHWTSAREHSRTVANQIVGLEDPLARGSVPYIWSDQYAKRIQVLGYPSGADRIEIADLDVERGSRLARYGRSGRLVAVVGCSAAGRTMQYRPQLARGRAAFDQE
jgi:NADPH-dependent 2,4-dienoyl-CoA reductase/sulfur reductase-like enzyme